MTLRAALAALVFTANALAAEPLPALGAHREYTVSGVSSGAFMAVQFHVAYSAQVEGVAAIAGGPYYCAQGSLWKALYNCMVPGWFTPLPAVAQLKSQTDRFAREGRIDATANLRAAPAWLFSGMRDETVAHEVVQALHDYYREFQARAILVADKRAGHGMVTQDAGVACRATEPPYINDCDYDAAGELLKHLLGTLSPPREPAGELLAFDQWPFGARAMSMDDEGFVYIPGVCRTESCRVHVVFHGCRQGKSFLEDRFVREAGYNRWAEANRMIVLYPQAIARYLPIYNPRGCWDWWGYTGSDYHTKEGAQMRAVKAMLERLSAPRQ